MTNVHYIHLRKCTETLLCSSHPLILEMHVSQLLAILKHHYRLDYYCDSGSSISGGWRLNCCRNHHLTSRTRPQSGDFPRSERSSDVLFAECRTCCILESGAHCQAISMGCLPARLPTNSLSCRNSSHCQNFWRRVISFREMGKEGCFAWGSSLKRSNFLKW